MFWFSFFAPLEAKPWATHKLDKCSDPDPHPLPNICFFKKIMFLLFLLNIKLIFYIKPLRISLQYLDDSHPLPSLSSLVFSPFVFLSSPSLLCVGQTFLGMGPAPECGQCGQCGWCHSVKEHCPSLSQQLAEARSSSASGGIVCPPPTHTPLSSIQGLDLLNCCYMYVTCSQICI